MTNYSLLNLNPNEAPKNEPEKVQMFNIELGIEKFRIGIPVTEVAAFESQVQSENTLTIENIKSIAESLNGFMRD